MKKLRTRILFLALIGSAIPTMPGCVTIWRHRELEARVAGLEKDKQDLLDEQKRDQDKMERLHRDLQEATEALRKGGANLGADVDEIRANVTKLRGSDEEMNWALAKLVEDVADIKKAMDEKLGVALVRLPKGLPEDRETLYKAGREAFDKGDLPTARGVLRKLIETFPDDPNCAEAQYLVAETFFKEGKFGQAVREYQRVHDRYRETKGAPVEKALLRIAESLLKQDDCKKAGGVLKYLAEYNKKAPEAEKAKEMLKGLKKKCPGL